MTIPLYNILATSEGRLNRAKARVIKKLANKFSQDVLLQDVDITDGKANEIAGNLILELRNIQTFIQQVDLYSNITQALRRGRRPVGVTTSVMLNKVKYTTQSSFDTFVGALTNLNTKLINIQSNFNSILPSINYVSSSNINELNTLLETLRNDFDMIFGSIDILQFFVNDVRVPQNKEDKLKGIVIDIYNIFDNMNSVMDTVIASYNDKTTDKNLQRMVAVQATEPRMVLKGGRRAYSVEESSLGSMLI